jgi:hypothetical protein
MLALCDFVTEPWNDARLTGSVPRHIATDDPRELNNATGVRLIAEDELRNRGWHEFWGYLFLKIRFERRQITSAAP